MNVQLTAHFYFKGNGKKKTVTWVESNPIIQQKEKETGKVIREIPLNADEVKQEYRRLFTKHKNEGKAITLEDTDDVAHIIDLTEVRDIELTAQEEDEDAVQTDIRPE
ncbi:hypothetical protein P4V86_03360 [Brevibacillus laterosporus]|uniref:hypothetical protein n=1 Tax=Brevibacillus laterosporus TaxID=1465 RepID=UPI0003787D06|nr:hypothetical protein [Brevibacillus laterosporus]ATO48560.1 hypothetical protein BrL25_05190 [Brevibacillus laterosporus DSM 25]MED2002396.1 hypothetical protein [Brevibacillus laterosporus]